MPFHQIPWRLLPARGSVGHRDTPPTFPGEGESRGVCLKYVSPNRNSIKIMGRILRVGVTLMKAYMSIAKNLANLFILKHLFLMSKEGEG